MDYQKMKDFKRIYKQDGAYHKAASGFKSWFLKDNYSAIAGYCSKGDIALDLACGEGCLAEYLDVKELVGVDFSEDALLLNKKLYPGRYGKLLVGDLRKINELPLDNDYFDKVICSLSFMYLLKEDFVTCLKNIAALLKKDGLLVFTYPTVNALRKGSNEAEELPPDVIAQVLSSCGFSMVEMKPFCPLVSKEVFDKSLAEASSEEAKREYESAKEEMTLNTSYHFICAARKAEDGR